MVKRARSTAVAVFAFAVFLTGCTSQSGNPGGGSPQAPPATISGNAQGVSAASDNSRSLSDRKIAIRVGEKAFTVRLYDNPTATGLVARLPITVTANDYAGYDEKVVRLPNPLSMAGAPDGDEPEIPEVGYYQPGQWIALYYGPVGYWPGKVPLGRIDASVDELRAIPDGASVTLEIAEN